MANIILDVSKKSTPVRVTTQAFNLENGVVTLPLEIVDAGVALDLTPYPLIAAAFSNGTVSPSLTYAGNVVSLPILQSEIEAGDNEIQLNLWGAGEERLICPKLLWRLDDALDYSTPASGDVDVLASFVAQVIAGTAAYAADASGSALAASTSEDNAAASELAAGASATNAGLSAAAAALLSEQHAATSETNAGLSATAASGSAQAASGSATAASNSAIAADNSADAALVSKNAAEAAALAAANTLASKADKTQEAWITPTLINGWTHVTGNEVKYMKDNFGFVHFKGRATPGTITTLMILPVGYRPQPPYNGFAIYAQSGSNGVGIDGAGNLGVTTMPTGWASLCSITFKAEA